MKWIFAIFSVVVVTGIVTPARACTPDCKGKQCGPDGCGGSCGTCQPPAKCVVDQCVKGCGAYKIKYMGDTYSCCYKGYALQCGYNGDFVWDKMKCATPDECRWDDIVGIYACDSSLPDYEDPTGEMPRECDFDCKPDCRGKNCGPDGCGGSCGTCKPGEECLPDQTCCRRDCEGKECGDDGCGGSCGKCDPWSECENGKCVSMYGCKTTPLPDCPDCACRDCVCKKDSMCCDNSWGPNCVKLCRDECGGCKKCVPQCDGKECGPDGCGGQCGHCKPGDTCKAGKCVKCVPDCTGKECGDDGCGGSCGECEPNVTVCGANGKCRPCSVECPRYAECGMNDCQTMGCEARGCHENQICIGNGCYGCYSYCTDRECGDDGCGGSCGKCGPCEQCISHHCKPIPDCVAPDTGPEPVPDTAEDVYIGRDTIEAANPGLDSGKPGKDVQKDRKIAKDTSKDITGHPDSTRDRQVMDAAGPDTNTKSSGGGCSTGPGSASGTWLIFLGLLAMLWRRRQRE